MRFPTMWSNEQYYTTPGGSLGGAWWPLWAHGLYVRPAKVQTNLRIRPVWSEPWLVAWNYMTPEFLSFKGGCRVSSESTLVKMPHCWKCRGPIHVSGLPAWVRFFNWYMYLQNVHLLRSTPFSSSAALNAIFIICCAQCHFHHLLRSMPFSSSNTSASQFLCTHLITSTVALKLRLRKKACFHGTVTNKCVHIDHSPVKLHASPDIIMLFLECS